MTRAVLDTVVFVRALINPHGYSGEIIKKEKRFQLLTSPPILAEVLKVLYRSRLTKKYHLSKLINIDEVLEIIKEAKVVLPKRKIRVCRDPEDDKFLECALEGKADYLVSEDKDLLVLKKYQGVKIINTQTFLQIIS